MTSPLPPRVLALLRPLPFVVAAALAAARGRGCDVDDRAPSPEAAIALALSARGIACEAGDVVLVDGPRGVARSQVEASRAIVRARPARTAEDAGEIPYDLFLVAARRSPEGAVLEVGDAWNLTRTSAVSESLPVVSGTHVAYVTSRGGIVEDVHTLDLSGFDPRVYADWTRAQKIQGKITNLVEVGQTEGVRHVAYRLDPPAERVDLGFTTVDGVTSLVAHAGRRDVVVDCASGDATVGAEWVHAFKDEPSAPTEIGPWVANTARALPWFGSDRFQVVKVVLFTALDYAARAKEGLGGDARKAAEEGAAADLAGIGGGPASTNVVDPDVGFPPGKLDPILPNPIEGEGSFLVLDHDPFITPAVPPTTAPDAGVAAIPKETPAAFATTFLRADTDHLGNRMYITMWDPRQIALHMEAGTIEPVSASGEAGPGVVPRTPEVLTKLVAGFNGGFQATHGEYGMQANGIEYLPPKPYAATVMEMTDGTTGFGSWPEDTDVPKDVLSYRQNMTAMIEGGKFNPWGRTWWGGVPPGWTDAVHTTRSGICLTKEGFVAYIWGNMITAEVLASTMKATRCEYGIHLDMNPGLAGFEFYSVWKTDALPDLGRPLQTDWEWQGPIGNFPGLTARARRMIRSMGEVNFPQWVKRDARDFFYLTRRSLLPGPPVAVAGGEAFPGEGVFHTDGLPQGGFPYALAATKVGIDRARPELVVDLLRIDPRTVTVAPTGDAGAAPPTIVSFYGPTTVRSGGIALAFKGALFSIGAAPPDGSTILAAGFPPDADEALGARGIAGIDDDDALVWATLPPSAPSGRKTLLALDAVVAAAGCKSRIALGPAARALLGDARVDPHGDAAPPPADPPVAILLRGVAPGGRLVFPGTPIVPPSVWAPLQARRVRYFPKPKPAPTAPTEPPPGEPPP